MGRKKGKSKRHALRMSNTNAKWRDNFIKATVADEGDNFPESYVKELMGYSRLTAMNIGYVDANHVYNITRDQAGHLDDVVPFKYMQDDGSDEYNRIYYSDLTKGGQAIFDGVLKAHKGLTLKDKQWAREHYLIGWICADELEEHAGRKLEDYAHYVGL